jgi:hypothetical protein
MERKFYISFEAKHLLKEKGFENNEFQHYTQYQCPTKAEIIDWLDSKGIYIEIHGIGFGDKRRWCYSVFNSETSETKESKYIYTSRFDAEEDAIKIATKLLKLKPATIKF